MIKNLLITFLFLLSLSSLLFNFHYYQQNQKDNTVAEVVDGDTFQLVSGKRVRLLGVDAPEYNRCGGAEARAFLSRLILDKPVLIKEEMQEAFGRSLALVYQDADLINEKVLEAGWGRPDYRKNSQRDILTQSFHTAKDNKRGVFSSLCREPSVPVNPDNPCAIKANIDKATYQKFYHFPGCKQYNQIIIEKDIGERYFCTEAEAQKEGFVKASGCP